MSKRNHRYRIKITAHAKYQVEMRGIREEDIVRIVNKLVETILAKYEQRYLSHGRAIDPYTKQENYLLIVHRKLNKPIIDIISVMWTDKGGLKRHGFSNL
jgi:hypothetical protein